MSSTATRVSVLAAFALSVTLVSPARVLAQEPISPIGPGPAPLSSAGEQLFMEALEAGQLLDHPRARSVRESFAFRARAFAGAEAEGGAVSLE